MADAQATARKVKRINKPFARKIQILTVLEQRAKVAGKNRQAQIAKRAKEEIRAKHRGNQATAKTKKKEEDLEKMALAKSQKVLKSGQNKNGEPSQVRSLLKQESVIYQKPLSKRCHHKNMPLPHERSERVQKKVSSSSSNPRT